MLGWRTAHASVIGTSHVATGTPCQDAGYCEVLVAADGSEVLVAAVADGAGSAKRSEEGARLAVRSFLSTFGPLAVAKSSLEEIDHARLITWFRDLRGEIATMAEAGGNVVGDYACTFLAAVVGPARAVFLQIGDGAIVVRDRDTADFSWMFWPQHGEFANTTNFLTQDNFEGALEIEIVEGELCEIAIFSDGIERLVLDIAGMTVHTPSLKPIFTWLAGTAPTVGTTIPAPGLVAYLGSEQINRRTDDDKTLVMATRADIVPTVPV